MPKYTSVILDDHFGAFVGSQVSAGKYGSASEVVSAGLKLLEERERARTALQSALIEGEESGISERTPQEIMTAVLERRQWGG